MNGFAKSVGVELEIHPITGGWGALLPSLLHDDGDLVADELAARFDVSEITCVRSLRAQEKKHHEGQLDIPALPIIDETRHERSSCIVALTSRPVQKPIDDPKESREYSGERPRELTLGDRSGRGL
jgi:hypothetical protein